MSSCSCGNAKEYSKCCEPFINGDDHADTAEKLMRSRYSAYVHNKVKHIANTQLDVGEAFDEKEASRWATDSDWQGLEVVSTERGDGDHKTGIVEFKASYNDKEGNLCIHHEISNFRKKDDQWYYVDGQIVGAEPIRRTSPKVGRNDPCSCGSGKKYKKCCGK